MAQQRAPQRIQQMLNQNNGFKGGVYNKMRQTKQSIQSLANIPIERRLTKANQPTYQQNDLSEIPIE